MDIQSRFPSVRALKRTATVVALAAVSMAASADLPTFTLNPAAAGLAGTAFTANNLLISNYSTVMSAPDGSFTESGFLSVTGAQLGSMIATTPGLNTDYGLYVQFTGSGQTTFGTDPMAGPTFGVLNSLTYTIYGYNGTATFDFDAAHTPTTTAAGAVALASGQLITGSGTVTTMPQGGSFSPSATATFTITPTAAGASFFAAPTPFMNTALAAFTNTSSQVQTFEGGFMIQQGGGTINFATAVPEPRPYALLAAGLAVIGVMARRRDARNSGKT